MTTDFLTFIADPEAAMISCRVATWRANAPRPAAVAVTWSAASCDKGLVDRDIAGFRQRSIWAPRLPSVAPVSFSAGRIQALARRQRVQRRHDFQPQRLMNDVVEFSHRSAPAHPEPAEDQAAAIDEGHPQRKRRADVEIADQVSAVMPRPIATKA